MRYIAPILAALSLTACTTLTPSQSLEQADTAASLAYAATATLCNDVAAAVPSKAAQAGAIKAEAEALLQKERALYAEGQSVAGLLTQLQALEAQALALKNGA